jgi:integrase
MTVEDVKARIKQLTADMERKRRYHLKVQIQKRVEEDNLKLMVNIPEHFLADFEKNFIPQAKDPIIRWKRAKEIILQVDKEPLEWCLYKQQFYKLFLERAYSYDYSKKILSYINKWGQFISEKQGKFYRPIALPPAHIREKINDTCFLRKGSKKSEPLNFQELEAKRYDLKPEHFNWLFIAIAFGLRPYEVNKLKLVPGDNTWKVKDKILWIFQDKLTMVPRHERTKPIPILYAEQEAALTLIRTEQFEQPHPSITKEVFKANVMNYCGRKNFTDRMLEKHSVEAVAQWLGHHDLDTLYKHYKSKTKVLY